MKSPLKKLYSILVVEDHEDSRLMMQILLELDGFRVFTATTGRRAVTMAAELKPSLILMDLNLPDIDGLAVTGSIRRNPALRGIPIIALTAYDMDESRDRALAAGCNEYMLKPVDFEKLEAALKRLLGVNFVRAGGGSIPARRPLAPMPRAKTPGVKPTRRTDRRENSRDDARAH